MRLPLSFAILAAVIVVPAQDPPVLANDEAAMRWDAAKNGPWMVVDPDRTVAVQEGTGLAAFARKRVTIRGVTAIVPTQMTLIVENPPEGNFVEGLPRDLKVLYLMSKLTPAQWKIAGGKGLGRDDLQGEPRAVLDSIIPRTFAWQRYRVNEQGRNTISFADGEKGVLSERDRAGIRLRISQSLTFRVTSADRPNSQTVLSTLIQSGKPGDIVYGRDLTAEREEAELFGVRLRQVVENRQKASHLPYKDRAFDPVLPLDGTMTVGEILRRVRTATGVEVLADLRVNDRKIVFRGPQVRAGDLLEALALSVTGTYRRIADAYVLTSDLDGMGARRLRLALWAGANTERTLEWQKKLIETLGAQNTRAKVPFDAKSPFAPDDTLRARLDKIGTNTSATDPFPTSDLSSDLQAFVKQAAIARSRESMTYDTAQVRMGSQIDFAFVMPDGTAMMAEPMSFGDGRNFAPGLSFAPRPNEVPSWQPVPVEARHRLIVRVINADEAKVAANEAKARGFGEVWLETTSTEAIRSAQTAGLPVRLAIRPWYPADASNPSDLTLLGDTGPQLQKRINQWPTWAETYGAYPEAKPSGRAVLIPGTSAQRTAWEAYEKLARTPGLAGTVLLDSRVPGYEADRVTGPASLTREMRATTTFGFSPAARLRFLRERGIDPIDVVPGLLTFDADLRQPFFLDTAQAGRNVGFYMVDAPPQAMNGIAIEWDRHRATLPEAALKDLQARLANAGPLSFEDPTPTTRPPLSGTRVLSPSTRWVYLPDPSQASLSVLNFRTLTRSGSDPMAFDATGIPIKKLAEALTRWKIGAQEPSEFR